MLLEGRRTKHVPSETDRIKKAIDGETNKLEQKSSKTTTCRNCGRNYPHTGAYPAKGKAIKITIDNGATINVIHGDIFNKMKDITLTCANAKAFAYSTKSPVEFLGKLKTVIEIRKRISVATFYVAEGKNCGNLLSLSTAQDLGLVSLHIDKLTSKDSTLENILQQNFKVFSGLGKLKGEKIQLIVTKHLLRKRNRNAAYLIILGKKSKMR